jgi:hypothetical protein
MSSVVWGDELPSPDPAIEIFRRPARFAELLHGKGELPPGTSDILQCAADAVRLGTADALTEAHRAALFFAEHVLLAHDADHYRVLGLEAQAVPAEIRERYHLLMRVFHPDRCGWLEIDAERLAARVNLAYQTLRNASTRAAYDLSLRQLRSSRPAAPVAEPAAAREGTRRGARRGARRRSLAERLVEQLPPVLRRNFAQFVLGCVAMIGVLMVAGAYYSRPPEGALGARRGVARVVQTPDGPPASTASVEPGAVAAKAGSSDARTENEASQLGAPLVKPVSVGPQGRDVVPPLAEASAVPLQSGGTVPSTASGVRAETTGSAVVATTPMVAQAIPVDRPAGSVAAGDSGATPTAASLPADVPPAMAESAESPRAAAAVVVAAEVPAAPRASVALGPDEARSAVIRFAELYQKGDIERFMQIFSADARSASGRRAEIRRDYEELFRTTSSRKVELADFKWSFDQLSGRGDGAYYIRVRRDGESGEEVFAGALRVDLVKHGNQVLISGLFHKPSQ